MANLNGHEYYDGLCFVIQKSAMEGVDFHCEWEWNDVSTVYTRASDVTKKLGSVLRRTLEETIPSDEAWLDKDGDPRYIVMVYDHHPERGGAYLSTIPAPLWLQLVARKVYVPCQLKP